MNNLSPTQISQVKHARMNSAVGCVSKTDSAALVLKNPSRAIWVGGGGTLVLVFADNSTGTLSGIPDGQLLPLCVLEIGSASTATDVVALI